MTKSPFLWKSWKSVTAKALSSISRIRSSRCLSSDMLHRAHGVQESFSVEAGWRFPLQVKLVFADVHVSLVQRVNQERVGVRDAERPGEHVPTVPAHAK